MKFKHTINVFIDNFSVAYKQLLYRLVIVILAALLYAAIIIPIIKGFTVSNPFIELKDSLQALFNEFFKENVVDLRSSFLRIKEAFEKLLQFVVDSRGIIAGGIAGIVAVNLVQRFFEGIGNYAMAAVINDKMALHANSPFLITLIRNLKEASLYNLIYIPLSFIYDAVCYIGIYFLIFNLFSFMYLPLQITTYVAAMIVAISFKMVFTSDWLPSLIRGKASQKKAFIYTFDRRGKKTFNVLSNYVVLITLILAVNVMAMISTFGAASLLTVPASYVLLIGFEFVNYYDREKLKYFIDKHTIIKPEKEHELTREEFFKGK